MTPTTTTSVVTASLLAALRKTEPVARAASDENLYLAGLKPKLDIRYPPWPLDTQNPTVQVCVSHPVKLRHLHHQSGRAFSGGASYGQISCTVV